MVELNPLQEAAALVDAGRWLEAEQLLRPLLSQPRAAAAAHYLLGLVFVRTSRMAEAVQAFRQACQLQPGLVAAWLNQAAALNH